MLEYWYKALASPVGIVIETDDAQGTLAALYRARSAAKDLALGAISIHPSPTNSRHLWLVKNGRDTPSTEGDPQSL